MPSWLNSAVGHREFPFRTPRLRPNLSPKPLANFAISAPPPPLLHSRVLITTDVWARGIDVQQVSLVINYDLPSYVFLCDCAGEESNLTEPPPPTQKS